VVGLDEKYRVVVELFDEREWSRGFESVSGVGVKSGSLGCR
jgi:hypothetical protein